MGKIIIAQLFNKRNMYMYIFLILILLITFDIVYELNYANTIISNNNTTIIAQKILFPGLISNNSLVFISTIREILIFMILMFPFSKIIDGCFENLSTIIFSRISRKNFIQYLTKYNIIFSSITTFLVLLVDFLLLIDRIKGLNVLLLTLFVFFKIVLVETIIQLYLFLTLKKKSNLSRIGYCIGIYLGLEVYIEYILKELTVFNIVGYINVLIFIIIVIYKINLLIIRNIDV